MARLVAMSRSLAPVCAIALTVCAAAGPAGAKAFHLLYAFNGLSDGYEPSGNLIIDKAGNLYGTTASGGVHLDGTVFMLAPDGTERVIYSFAGGNDGAIPIAGVVRDKSGSLFGTTNQGGTSNCGGEGCGTAFKISASGSETVLHVFTGGNDGSQPTAELLQDKEDGNLYGTTWLGGASGHGLVFSLSPDGTETVLHAFAGGSDGIGPGGALLRDTSGYLYGTTAGGGSGNSGTVFRISASGTETVLYSFKGGKDGDNPLCTLIEDAAGNFYGTTLSGGRHNAGTVFKVASDGTETVLYSFKGRRDGAGPNMGLTVDGAGNFYGTTLAGGGACENDYGCGAVFRIATDGSETILHRFTGKDDGSGPDAGLLLNKTGELFGTAQLAGADDGGTVFMLKK